MPKRRPRLDISKEIAIEEFGNKAEVDKINALTLNDLSLTELARHYKEIDRQSHILKGKIILAARSRFTSDREFGLWLSDNLSDLNQKQAHRLMCIAEFFDESNERSMEGIGLSACYELAAPQYREIAEQIYQEVAGKNFPLAVIKEKLTNNQIVRVAIKGTSVTGNNTSVPINNDMIELVDIIINNILANLKPTDAIKILKQCIIAIETDTNLDTIARR
jgi:hypothetical protein